VPCKSTLDAFAFKMNLEMPTYNTINQMQKRLPPFTSSLVFNGVSYIGEAGRNKGQAEVLAARTVILSLLGIHFLCSQHEFVLIYSCILVYLTI
jgi:hypothetical protein